METTVTDHIAGGLNQALTITARGLPGTGGAHARYDIRGNTEHIPNIGPRPVGVNLRFQEGPITRPEDINGISNEALLAVVIHRLRGFQSGACACRENACALTKLEEALMWLHKRTRDREARGVEGTHDK